MSLHPTTDGTVDLLAEMRATPAPERVRRLAKLAKPMLVHLAAVALCEWERQEDALRRELAALAARLALRADR